ncbi:MAG: DUF3383 domain-containing protein [Desulfarculales bacterium]|jgi:hypothetical protein|nr:DUF3383 domain-containing protein [Desulfarculales bacterium]
MAIPASHIVNVLPRVINGGSANLELNGLLLSANPLIPAGALVLSFPSAAAVGDYFGLNSAEYLAADIYFTSYNNKQAAPRAFLVARRIGEDAPAWTRGGKMTQTVAQLKTITDGGMALSIDNTAVSIANVNFSSAGSYSDAAALLQAALAEEKSGTTVSWSSLTGAFTVTSPTAGANSQVSWAAAGSGGTDLSALLNLSESSGAVLSPGLDKLSVAEQMAAVRAKTQNWVSFTTAWETDGEETLAWAAWAGANYGWLYVAWSTDPLTVSADSQADPASRLQEAGFDHTAIIYGGLEYAAFIMGVVASIAWQRVNGTITVSFKRQSGLAPWVVDEAAAAILEGKGCNYFGNFATRNAEFVFLYPGCLSASDYGYIDPYVNSIWLNNRLQAALMDGITTSGRVPYSQRGYTMIAAWMMDPINEARNNAAIEQGVVLSEQQKSEIMNEAGLDISGELWTQGYYIQVLDPGATVRAQRGSPVISLWYTYGGAVQKIQVASTAIL